MSFETDVTLGIEIDSGELRSAKRAIEDELGDVSVGVSSDRARADGGGAGGQSGRRSRRLFRWARQRTQHTEEMVELLTEIEEDLDDSGGLLGGRGGGGGGGLGGLGGLVPPLSFLAGRGTAGGGAGGILGRVGGFLSGAAGTAAGALGSGTAAAVGAPLAGAGIGLGLTLGTGRNMEAINRFQQEQQRRQGIFGGGRLGPPQGGDGTVSEPSWLTDFLSGEIDRPGWVTDLLQGGGDGTRPSSFGPRSPNAPGAEFGPPVDADASEQGVRGENGAQRIQIDFEQTLENTQGITPEQAERLVDDKLSEVEREIARSTGRGAGGTRIP